MIFSETCKERAASELQPIADLIKIWDPPTRLRPSEWAEQYRRLTKEASSKSGRFRNFPWQVQPADDLLNPEVQSSAWQWASQLTGKTEGINNVVGYKIEQDPAPMLMIQYSLNMARTWVKDRFNPMVRDTPVLHGLVRDARVKKDEDGSTMLHKLFPGGRLTVIGSNAPGEGASRPIELCLFDEIDRYKPTKEGDLIAIAEKRMESFPNAFSIKVSTPTIKGSSAIEKEISLTDKNKWFCPCPNCKHEFVIEWQHVKWPNPKNPKHPAPEHTPKEAYIECPSCGAEMNDEQRQEMVRAGRWKPTAPFTGKRGYILNGIVCLMPKKRGFINRLHQFVVDFLAAKAKGPGAMQVWTNTFLAETWESESEKPTSPEILYARRETYSKPDILLPERCVILSCGADVQADRIEAEISGWGENEESWGVEYRVFKGNVEQWDLWNEFDQWIQSKFKHVSGQELQPAVVVIDANHKGKMVKAFCRRCFPRNVYPVIGRGSSDIPWVRKSKNQRIVLANVSVAKQAIYGRAKIIDHGPNYMHFPESYPLEWFQQLMSERMVTHLVSGVRHLGFELQPGARNEALDARVYGMAGIEIIRPNYRKLATRLKPVAGEQAETSDPAIESVATPAPKPPETIAPQQKPPHIQQIRRIIRRKPTGWMRM